MEITRGVIGGAKKVLVYGPEGIGKTTFASAFPDPLFIDTEGSTKEIDVARLPVPSSWTMIKEEVRYVLQNPDVCKTLVIDTADWAEKMAIQSVLDEHSKAGIEDFGYGSGYRYVLEKFGELLNLLTDVVRAGINVVLTAHATLRKFEQPDEMGAYDRYTMKLIDSPKTSICAAVKEWSDMVLFANYKTIVIIDSKTKKTKAQGGQRIMYTTHHTCWDAKNRYGLPEEMPFSYDSIRNVIEGSAAKTQQKPNPAAPAQREEKQRQNTGKTVAKTEPKPEPAKEPEPVKTPDPEAAIELPHIMENPEEPDKRIPKALRDLMIKDGITEWDIMNFCEAKQWVTFGAKIWEYETCSPGLIDGGIVAQWPKVRDTIRRMREEMEIPFA